MQQVVEGRLSVATMPPHPSNDFVSCLSALAGVCVWLTSQAHPNEGLGNFLSTLYAAALYLRVKLCRELLLLDCGTNCETDIGSHDVCFIIPIKFLWESTRSPSEFLWESICSPADVFSKHHAPTVH